MPPGQLLEQRRAAPRPARRLAPPARRPGPEPEHADDDAAGGPADGARHAAAPGAPERGHDAAGKRGARPPGNGLAYVLRQPRCVRARPRGRAGADETADESRSGSYATVSYHFTRPSVNLDHSEHVSVTRAGAGVLEVAFHSHEAFGHAARTWSADRGLVLIAFVRGCGDYALGRRCYFDVASLEADASGRRRRIVARGAARHPDDVMSSGATEWGWRRAGPSSGRAAAADAGSTRAPGPGPRCVAPPDAKYGLPTACLGEGFDGDLDDGLGYAATAGRGANATALRRHALARRRSRSAGPRGLKSLKKFVSDAYHSVAEPLRFSTGIDKKISWALPSGAGAASEANRLLDAGARQVASPWGDAVLLRSWGSASAERNASEHLDVFCVDCGARGTASVAGKASWSLLHGITAGHVAFDLDMHFGLKVGVDARMSYRGNLEADLLRVGLPGLSYGVVTVPPQVAVGARIALEAAADGRLLAGADVGLPASHVVVDMVDSSRSDMSRGRPYLRPVLKVEGDVIVSASVALPVSLECGLDIGAWHKAVAIKDEPMIRATAQTAAAGGVSDRLALSDGFEDSDGCKGISGQITWRNKLWVDVLDLKTAKLHDTGDRHLSRVCYPCVLSCDPPPPFSFPPPPNSRRSSTVG